MRHVPGVFCSTHVQFPCMAPETTSRHSIWAMHYYPLHDCMAISTFAQRSSTHARKNLVFCSQMMDQQVDETLEQRRVERKQERDRRRRTARLYTPQDPTVTASTDVSA